MKQTFLLGSVFEPKAANVYCSTQLPRQLLLRTQVFCPTTSSYALQTMCENVTHCVSMSNLFMLSSVMITSSMINRRYKFFSYSICDSLQSPMGKF